MKEIDGLELNYLALLISIICPIYITVDMAISVIERNSPLLRQGETFSVEQIEHLMGFGITFNEGDLKRITHVMADEGKQKCERMIENG